MRLCSGGCGKVVPVKVKDKDWRGWRYAIISARWICPECYVKLPDKSRTTEMTAR